MNTPLARSTTLSRQARIWTMLLALTIAVVAATAPARAASPFGIAYWVQSDADDWHTVNGFAFHGGNVIWVGDVGATVGAVGHFRFAGLSSFAGSTVGSAWLRFTAASKLSVDPKTPLRLVITSDQPCPSQFSPGEPGGWFTPTSCNRYGLTLSSWVEGTTYQLDVTSAVQRLMQEDPPTGRAKVVDRTIEFEVVLLSDGAPRNVRIVAHESDPALAASLAVNWN